MRRICCKIGNRKRFYYITHNISMVYRNNILMGTHNFVVIIIIGYNNIINYEPTRLRSLWFKTKMYLFI